MNMFEDLVVELKQENLLETTVIDIQSVSKNSCHKAGLSDSRHENGENILLVPRHGNESKVSELSNFDSPKKPHAKSDVESLRKQSMEEIAALQMVEHLLTGIESNFSDIEPKSYDDLPAKKALHRFLQAADDPESEECFEAESAFLREVDMWRDALAKRDAVISVADLRHYSETTHPPLSSQALFALLRFYRNADYNEAVRTKFDFTATRLFSKNMGDFTRQMLFDREETIGHFRRRYSDWAGTEYFTLSDDDPDVLLNVLSFGDFTIEAENADNFDELVQSDFFSRFAKFKNTIGSAFFSPVVAAAAIECNVKIGNKYIELLAEERVRVGDQVILEKYGEFDNRGISDFLGRNLEMRGYLDETADLDEETSRQPAPAPIEVKTKAKRPTAKEIKIQDKEKFFDFTALKVNKWLLATTIVIVTASIGLYISTNYMTEEVGVSSSSSVKTVDLENSPFKEYLKAARISNETFYGMTNPSWDTLNREKKEEILKSIYKTGAEKGFKKVQLVKEQGKAAAFASDQRIEIYNP